MSICRWCKSPITWLPRPNGSFYPPFEAEEQIENAEYEVSSASGSFLATLVNTEIQVKLRPHRCREYTERTELPPISAPDDDENAAERSSYQRIWETGYSAGRRSMQGTMIKVQPTHEQSIGLAKRLAHRCPKCDAAPFAWCTYIRGEQTGEETKQLHTDRWRRGGLS
jgi:hypothetical protein